LHEGGAIGAKREKRKKKRGTSLKTLGKLAREEIALKQGNPIVVLGKYPSRINEKKNIDQGRGVPLRRQSSRDIKNQGGK